MCTQIRQYVTKKFLNCQQLHFSTGPHKLDCGTGYQVSHQTRTGLTGTASSLSTMMFAEVFFTVYLQGMMLFSLRLFVYVIT